jgi:hypothetical protein
MKKPLNGKRRAEVVGDEGFGLQQPAKRKKPHPLGAHLADQREVTQAELAKQINTEVLAAQRDGQSSTEHAVLAGAYLIEAKGRVKHGEWAPWLAKNCTALSEKSAQTYMRLARRIPELPDSKGKRVSDLPIRKALAAVANHMQPMQAKTQVQPKLSDEMAGFVSKLLAMQRGLSGELRYVKTNFEVDPEHIAALDRMWSDVKAAVPKAKKPKPKLARRGARP